MISQVLKAFNYSYFVGDFNGPITCAKSVLRNSHNGLLLTRPKLAAQRYQEATRHQWQKLAEPARFGSVCNSGLYVSNANPAMAECIPQSEVGTVHSAERQRLCLSAQWHRRKLKNRVLRSEREALHQFRRHQQFLTERVTEGLDSRRCVEDVSIVDDFALQFPDLSRDDLSGVDASLELGHDSVSLKKMIPMGVDLVFNEEEHPDTASLLKSAPHLPGQDNLVAHVLVDLRIGLQNRLRHLREVTVEEVEVAICVHLVCQHGGSLQVQKHEDSAFPTGAVVASGYVPQEHAGSQQPVEVDEEEQESDHAESFNHPDETFTLEDGLRIVLPRDPIYEYVQEIEYSERQVHDPDEHQRFPGQMDEKGKAFEPVLEKEELGEAYRKPKPESQEERARVDCVFVNEVKRYRERNHGQTELRRCQQPPARVGLHGKGRQLSHLI
jgi:hypothetical protein